MGVDAGTGAGVKLIASMIVRNELGRYLEPCLRSLLGFCDEVRILDDASDEPGWPQALNGAFGADGDRIVIRRTDRPTFYEHEGRARNQLLAWTLEGKPSHVLAIDADEFVTDGNAVREVCEADQGRGAWALGLQEVWKADEQYLWTREDGGWKAQGHGIPVLWRVPSGRVAHTGAWQIAERKLACGREPQAVRRIRPLPVRSHILHFGWTCEADRQARYQRYVDHDGGKFHRSAHLDSIMWPDEKVRLRRMRWPDGLDRQAILARTQLVPA